MISNVCSWKGKDVQIDLLIVRGDNVVNICEMKFCNDQFVIDKAYADNLQHKIEAFREATATRSALHLTLITTFGVAHNGYLNQVQSEVTLDGLFL